jgi:nitrous oxidase accessory protein NosD
MKTKTTLFAVLAASLFTPSFALAYTIDSTGGDCESIGLWDGSTCTLTQNISEPITITGSGITLDGNNHFVTGDSLLLTGVFVTAVDVTVKNLTIQGFSFGMSVGGGAAGNALIRNNTILGPGTYGISGNDADGGTFTGNIVRNFNEGLHFEYCSGGHVFSGNTIEDNAVGASFQGSTGTFFQNNFKNNTKNIENVWHLFDCGGGFETLSRMLPLGGNYWSDNTACEDADYDNVCDTAFLAAVDSNVSNVYDNFPWKQENGWTLPITTQSEIQLKNATETEDDGMVDG